MDLIIKFTDDTPNFAKGVEYGVLLSKFQLGIQHVDNCGFPVRIDNKELIIATCKTYGYTPVFGTIHFEYWIEFMAIKNATKNN